MAQDQLNYSTVTMHPNEGVSYSREIHCWKRDMSEMSAELPRRRRILECLAELPVEEAFIFAIVCSTKAKSHAVNLCLPFDI